VHRSCAYAIFASVAYIALTKVTGVWDDYSLIIGETIAVLAFGFSWAFKGAEWDMLLGRPERAAPAPEVPVQVSV
jgi:hypothetical protein